MKNCSLWEGLKLDKYMENCPLWEGPHTETEEDYEQEGGAEMCDEETAMPLPHPSVPLDGEEVGNQE